METALHILNILATKEVIRHESREYGSMVVTRGVVTYTLDEAEGLIIVVNVNEEAELGTNELRFNIEVMKTVQVNEEGDAVYERTPLPNVDVDVTADDSGKILSMKSNSSTSTLTSEKYFKYAGIMLAFVHHVATNGIDVTD